MPRRGRQLHLLGCCPQPAGDGGHRGGRHRRQLKRGDLASGTTTPDVALVDINLGSESGFALATSLADPIGRAPTPIILMSTHAEDDYGELIEASPAVGFLSKSRISGSGIRRLLEPR
jgi:CheY-like chemotaxis protein